MNMKEIPFANITVGENYSREDVGDVSTLAASIREHGLQQPMVVDSDWNLVAGFRRYAALELNGFDGLVWVSITESDNPPVVNLIENLERQNLTFYQEALAVRRLFPDCSDQQVADAVGLTRGWSRPRNQLWRLPQGVIDKVKAGELTASNIQAILNAKDTEEACKRAIGGEKITVASKRPSKRDIQEAITVCLERDLMEVAQTFRWVLGDISVEEFWDSLDRTSK